MNTPLKRQTSRHEVFVSLVKITNISVRVIYDSPFFFFFFISGLSFTSHFTHTFFTRVFLFFFYIILYLIGLFIYVFVVFVRCLSFFTCLCVIYLFLDVTTFR